MSDQEHDYSEFTKGEVPVGGNLMARIEGLAQEQLDADTRVANLEEQLAEAKVAWRNIAEKRLPELLEESGLTLSTITTPAGHVVKVAEAIRGSIPKANEVEAFQWLEDNDNGNLIKRNFSIDFGKGDEKWAEKFQRDCAQRKRPLNLKRTKKVHPQSLQAFVRQQLEDGIDFPLKTFGVFRQKLAKVTLKTEA